MLDLPTIHFPPVTMSASSSSLADRVKEEVSDNDRGGVVSYFIYHILCSILSPLCILYG